MNLKPDIKKIFDQNSEYSNPIQAVNQASSLNALSGDLYTDSRRFIYELLQNADDSSLDGQDIEVWVKVFDQYLVVAHSGKAFDARDLRGICDINNGTKKSDSTKTGYKGIGFKSVFGQSDCVIIYTNEEYFRFDSANDFGWRWKETKESWEKENDREFQFPWQIIPIYTESGEVLETINRYIQKVDANVATIIKLNNLEETRDTIQNLSQNLNMFLFLKNISKIHFDISTPCSLEIDRTVQNRVYIKQNDKPKANWLKKTIHLEVPKELNRSLQDEKNRIPEKLLNTNTIELSLAAKVGNNGIVDLSAQEKLLYSYLPTDETKYSLPVLVNTSFLTTANRESLHADSKWNQWLFKNISVEIFKWIAELVTTEFQYQAYRLIPEKTRPDELGNKFNEGINLAIKEVPFILAGDNELVKVDESVIDFTFLSTKEFVGETPIKSLINKKNNCCKTKKFSRNTGYGLVFKKLGANCFEWNDVIDLLRSEDYIRDFTIDKNIKLIKHFKSLSESDKVKHITTDFLRKTPFIRDQKNIINYPSQICFPESGDDNWNDPKNELSFIHKDIQDWLQGELEIRIWLEALGVTEKTDITYIKQTILPDIEEYITHENAIQTIRDLFLLYQKEALDKDLINKLSELKILTQKETLLPANDCYLSDTYQPRLKIEKILEKDIFVSESYGSNSYDKSEWKRFFKMMGVNDGISPISYEKKSKSILISELQFENGYFEEEDKYFHPHLTKFNADEYSELTTLIFLSSTKKSDFSKLFWNDCISNIKLDEIHSSARAFWGNPGYPGRVNGNAVSNYLKWFIRNNSCIPTLMKVNYKADDVFLNSEEIIKVTGNYLPVFSGNELSQDWKSFFEFKTKLQLSDYLELLDRISNDISDKEKIKNGNYEQIQSIYSILLDQSSNWSTDDISKIEQWAYTALLLNTKKQFTKSTSLKYFIDGNESIFQEQFVFLSLNAENKNHASLEHFLNCFKIKILKQSDFKLDYSKIEGCYGLIDHLKMVIPYFKIWIDNETKNEKVTESFTQFQSKIEKLNIYQASELLIKYENIDFIKRVNVHFNNTDLFVTTPWKTNSVLLKLPEVLCRYFYLPGHDKKLDFLLRSNIDEIQTYFKQEGIDIPEDILNIKVESSIDVEQKQDNDALSKFDNDVEKGKIQLEEFFHTSKSNYKSMEYAEKIIMRAAFNVLNHLNKISGYDCVNASKITNSIIGGITKNGNRITIVARPSDGGMVLPYYSSEFDVLEYVDAEFWCEDGINTPKRITLGQLLKQTGINRIPIPINSININDSNLESLLSNPKSKELDFNAVPYTPEEVAKIISSFANTEGGTLIFGLKEISPGSHEIVSLSSDFNLVEIVKKAMSLLSPIPIISYDWIITEDNSIFIIQTEASDIDILFNNQKFIREGIETVVEESKPVSLRKLVEPEFSRTIAIIIGIEDYAPKVENQISSVKYADADVLKFKNILIENMGINEGNIHTFLNGEVLKSTLEYDLSQLFHHLTENDRLIFYYVGHGFHNGVTNYLSTYDMHKYHISETAVSLRKILLDPLRNSKCKTALIFIDACAQSFKDENGRNEISDINDDELMVLTSEFPYYGIFLSCQPGQSSYSSDNLKNGIWTHHLERAMSGDIPEVIFNNKYITDRLLMDYLSTSVSKYTKTELNYDQNPRAILDSSNENVIVELEK